MIRPKQPKQPKRIPAKHRRTIETRSGGVCESCGDRPASEIHHRQYLSRGGSHDVHNLAHLCGWGNHTGCHGRAHKDGEREGLAIGMGYRSELQPLLYRGVWVLPDDDGGLKRLSDFTPDFLTNGGIPDD